jgi:uncharacterized membrane protein YjjP (DUF1212 family)
MRRTGTAGALALLVAVGLGWLLAGPAVAAAGDPGAGAGAAAAVESPAPAVTSSATAVPPAPTPTPSVSPAPPGPTTGPTDEPAPAPGPTSTAPAPTPTPTTGGAGADEPDDDAGATRRPASPPAVTSSPVPWGQLIAALAVVVAGAVAVVVLAARRARAVAAADPGPVAADGPAGPPAPPEEVLRLMVTSGEAMIDAGHTVSSVAETLDDIAAAHGIPGAETVVLPTALLVSVPQGQAVATAAVTTGRRPLDLYQVDDLADVLRDATVPGSGVAPAALAERVAAVRDEPRPFGPLARLAGYLLLSVGLAALLGGSWVDLLVAGALGVAVGAVQIAVPPLSSGVQVALTVAVAFGVALAVLLLARGVPHLGVLPSVIAPLALFLPGGLLTTGVLELAAGQMLSGAGRLAAGTMQLALLAGGIVGAAALVGVPELDLSASDQPLGPVAPWVGVVLFGVGTMAFRCGRPRTTGWVVLVLLVAYGAQVVGGAFFGGELSAFVGALAMTPVALVVARCPSGPSPLVSFLPAFWMLVPGALGLVGVATLLDGGAGGISTLVSTASTMLGIALGVLLGLAASRALPGLPHRRGADGLPGTAVVGWRARVPEPAVASADVSADPRPDPPADTPRI